MRNSSSGTAAAEKEKSRRGKGEKGHGKTYLFISRTAKEEI